MHQVITNYLIVCPIPSGKIAENRFFKLVIMPSNAGPICARATKLVIDVAADGLALNNAKPSAGTAMIM